MEEILLENDVLCHVWKTSTVVKPLKVKKEKKLILTMPPSENSTWQRSGSFKSAREASNSCESHQRIPCQNNMWGSQMKHIQDNFWGHISDYFKVYSFCSNWPSNNFNSILKPQKITIPKYLQFTEGWFFTAEMILPWVISWIKVNLFGFPST